MNSYKCDCAQMSCPENCQRRHTHKGFFCEKCHPERYTPEWQARKDVGEVPFKEETRIHGSSLHVFGGAFMEPVDNEVVNNNQKGLQEEPWVAEFDDLYTRRGDTAIAYAEDFVDKDEVVIEPPSNLKSFIQKTLEADRKERAGVMIELIRVMPSYKTDFVARHKVEVIIKDVMK